MVKSALLLTLVFFLGCTSVFAQGPCSSQSSNLACVLPQAYGSNPNRAFTQVLYQYGPNDGHPFHYINDFSSTLKPLTADIGRQANLLPRKRLDAIGCLSGSAISFLSSTK